MPREDLVFKAREESTAKLNLPQTESAHAQDDAEMVELVRQAAKEIEASAWSPRENAREVTPAPGDWPEYQLPHGYNRTRIVLLVRDPYWLHCYWEIGSAERDAFRGQTGRELWELPNILRILDLTGPGRVGPAIHWISRSIMKPAVGIRRPAGRATSFRPRSASMSPGAGLWPWPDRISSARRRIRFPESSTRNG